MARSWYLFVGTDDPTNVEEYYKIYNGKHNCLCGHKICAIYATGTGKYPENPLSANMQLYIKNALKTQLIQPEMPIGTKKYVYLRDI